MPTRRRVLQGCLALAGSGRLSIRNAIAGTQSRLNVKPRRIAGWLEKTPDAVGLDPASLQLLRRRLHERPSKNIHSALIIKDSALVFEEYLTGTDEHWGDHLGVRS